MLRAIRRRLVGLCLLLPLAAAALDGRIYFDAALPGSPAQQGLVFLTQPLVNAGAVQGATNEGWFLDTRPQRTSQAGWFSRLPFNSPDGHPDMDRAAGFLVSFILQVAVEEHVSEHRAGFSVIALAADLWGIELGFWTNAVWAQSGPDFQRAEAAAWDTTAAVRRYDLVIAGSRYALHGAGRLLLAGPLRQYAAFGAPYATPRFVFAGDNTSSASARFVLGRLAVWTRPRLAGAAGPAGEITVTAEAEPGRPWVLERTADYTGWTEAANLTPADSPFTFGPLPAAGGPAVLRLRAGD